MGIPNPEDFKTSDPRQAGFQLSAKEQHIVRVLKRIHPRLPEIYLGGVQIFYATKHPERIPQAAHSFRELMEKIFFWPDRRQEQGMKAVFNDRVVPRWNNELRNLFREEPGSLTSKPKLLHQFFQAFDQFVDWVDAQGPSRTIQSQESLERLQRRRPSPEELEADAQVWKKLRDDFTNICHHRSEIDRSRFAEQIVILENLLLRYGRSIEADKHRAIAQIVAEAGDPPTPAHLQSIKALIDGWADKNCFLRQIECPAWLPLLLDDGWYDASMTRFPDEPTPHYFESSILEKFSQTLPTEVERACRQLAQSGDPRVHINVLNCIVSLASNRAADFANEAIGFVENGHPFLILQPLKQYLRKLAESGKVEEFLRVAKVVVSFRPDNEKSEKFLKQNVDGLAGVFAQLEPRPRWPVSQYQGLCAHIVQTTSDANALAVFEMLCSSLNEAIELSIWEDERQTRNGWDESTYWRPAIEEHPQNRNFGHKEQLVTAIRDLAERAIRNGSLSLREIQENLAQFPWDIFVGLKLHFYRLRPESTRNQITETLLDPALRDNFDLWHEWALLFAENFKNLKEDQQIQLLNWIENGFKKDASIEGYRQFYGAEPAPDLVARWEKHWQCGKLSLISDELHEAWAVRYSEMVAEFGNPDHPDMLHWSGDARWLENRSPVSAEDMLALSTTELVRRIEEWKPEDPQDETNEWGLLGALKEAAQQGHGRFLKNADACRALGSLRYLAILEGIFLAGIAGEIIDWPALLERTQQAIVDVVLPEARRAYQEGNREATQGLGIEIIRLVTNALEKDESTLPVDCRSAVWRIIKTFLSHPQPRPTHEDDATSARDMSLESLNTVRAIALRSVFAFASWVRRKTNIEEGPVGAADVLEVLDQHLDPNQERSRAVRSIYGEQFTWLLHYYPKWTSERVSKIFPSEANEKSLRDAAWGSFVTTSPYIPALEVLQSEYRQAVEETIGRPQTEEEAKHTSEAEKGLVHHLMAFYWWGCSPIETDSLIRLFFGSAPIWLRKYAFEYLGRSMESTKEGLPPAVQDRSIKLLEWRLEALATTQQAENSHSEIEGFFWWVWAQRLDPEWILTSLMKVLDLLATREAASDFLLLEPLARYSPRYPLLCVRCLRKLVQSPQQEYGAMGNENELKTILRNAINSDNAEAKGLGEEVQDALLRMGRSQLMDLGNAHRQTGNSSTP